MQADLVMIGDSFRGGNIPEEQTFAFQLARSWGAPSGISVVLVIPRRPNSSFCKIRTSVPAKTVVWQVTECNDLADVVDYERG